MTAHKILAILASVTSVCGGGLGSMYLYSLESFSVLAEEKKWLKEDLPDKAWNKAKDLFNTRKNNVEIISYLFKDLDERIKNNSDNATSDLKKACLTGYSTNHKSIFFENKTMLKNLNTFCRLQVKDMFDPQEMISEDQIEDKALLEKVNELLKNHKDKKLGNIGNNIKQGKFTWDKYKEWCNQQWYESFYLGDDDRNWKITNQYCKKTLES